MDLYEFLLINLNLVVFFLFYLLVIERQGNWNLNRWYLILMPILSIAIPFLPLGLTPPSDVDWVFELREVTILGEGTGSKPSVPIGINMLYVVILTSFIGILLFRLSRIRKVLESEPYTSIRGVDVQLLRSESASTFSFFGKIFLAKNDVGDQHPILLHEYAHVREYHSVDIILMKLLTALLWFNPVIFLWEKKMKENHEYLADAYVLRNNFTPLEYGQAILTAAMGTRVPIMSNAFFSKSIVRKRIERLQISKPKNLINMKYLLIVPMLSGMIYMASCDKSIIEDAKETTQTDNRAASGEMAEFPGGKQALMDFMIAEMKYPKHLEKEGVEGKAIVQFKIDEEGNVVEPTVTVSSGHNDLDNEAIRVVSQMPQWTPATKGGKAVSTEFKLPIQFKLAD